MEKFKPASASAMGKTLGNSAPEVGVGALMGM